MRGVIRVSPAPTQGVDIVGLMAEARDLERSKVLLAVRRAIESTPTLGQYGGTRTASDFLADITALIDKFEANA